MTNDARDRIRAALGDAQALRRLADAQRVDDFLAALLVCDPDPSPLATLTVAALHPAPPQAICDAARRRLPAALRELCQDACADLRVRRGSALIAAAWSLGLSDQADALAAAAYLAVLTANVRLSADLVAAMNSERWAAIADNARRFVCVAAVCNAERTADLLQRIGADGWALTPPDGRAALLHRLATNHWRAAEGGAAVWSAMTDEERVAIAYAVAQSARAAVNLLQRIGADGWRITPPDGRAALLRAVATDHWRAAEGGSAVWNALTADERAVIVHAAARDPDAAADLLMRIGGDGLRLSPPDGRATLLQALATNAQCAAAGGAALWSALTADERAVIAHAAARAPDAAADLLQRIGGDGWALTPPDGRAALLRAVATDHWRAAEGGSAVWNALTADERAVIVHAAARDPDAATDLLMRIGNDGLRLTPPDGRAALLRAVATDAQCAADGGGTVWGALTADERAVIAHAAARAPDAAVRLLQCIGIDGWVITPPDGRAALLQALATEPWFAAECGSAVWNVLTADERAVIAHAAARNPDAAADLLMRIGGDGWTLAPDAARNVLLRAVMPNYWNAARCGGALWNALTADERASIVHTVAPNAHAAADLIERIGVDGWTLAPDAMRHVLVRTIATDSWIAAHGGGALWDALTADERAVIAHAAARNPDAAADLIERIGGDGWTLAPDAARNVLLRAVMPNYWNAARCGGALWNALTADERTVIAHAVAPNAHAAAALIARIGVAGWRLAPDAARAALLQSLEADPQSAAEGGAAAWDALTDEERARVIEAVAAHPDSAATLMIRLGADGWSSLPAPARATLLDDAMRRSRFAANLLASLWDALDATERDCACRSAAQSPAVAGAALERIGVAGAMDVSAATHAALLDAVCRAPAMAARGVIHLGAAWSDHQRMRLLRAAFADQFPAVSFAVAHALHTGAAWRPWMLAFAPDANADADLKASWRDHARHLPPAHAVALLTTRSPRR